MTEPATPAEPAPAAGPAEPHRVCSTGTPGTPTRCGRPVTGTAPICLICANQLAALCLGKHPLTEHYANRVARRAARQPDTEPVDAYPCPVCSYWHVGRTAAEHRRQNVAAILRGLRTNRHGGWLTITIERWRTADRDAWKAANARHSTTNLDPRAAHIRESA